MADPYLTLTDAHGMCMLISQAFWAVIDLVWFYPDFFPPGKVSRLGGLQDVHFIGKKFDLGIVEFFTICKH